MAKQKLFWKIFPAFLLITLLALAGGAWYASRSLRTFYMHVIESELESRANVVASHVNRYIQNGERQDLDRLCKELGRLSDTRITVIDTDGTVLADSVADPKTMENHGNRPELQRALVNEVGMSTRRSPTLKKTLKYVAVPLTVNGDLKGAVRTARALTSVEEALAAVYLKILTGGVFVGILAVAVSLVVTRRITQPLQDIQIGAEHFACGNLRTRLPDFDSRELSSLAGTMNQMAAQLDDRMRALSQQRSEAEAILSSMVEGVLAVDNGEHILKINHAAARMLSISPDEAVGKNVRAVIRNPSLQQTVSAALTQTAPVADEVTFHNGQERILRIQGTTLKAEGLPQPDMGAVLVLNDVTNLRRLEEVRREFVANVSHELRTPTTSIQGFVETLLEGALENKDNTIRFLNIILKQAKRLNAIIEDLLLLSRIESEEEQPVRKLQETNLKQVLLSAVEVCESKAREKNVTIELHCPPDSSAHLNPLLFEQAVANLVDNAVNYSEPNSSVRVTAKDKDNECLVSIQDFGCGIPSEHVPRLFERFYRIDKARSREVGGTGLGLAIVKHIVQDHGGSITVDSQVGKGSTFTIHLPR
ncbi:MAG: HAMP domain-containing protein [Candidatus Pacebacteria bacterium]|nr:HAMP domain-containing protein [Candidatus Paceibacterota bacterium]